MLDCSTAAIERVFLEMEDGTLPLQDHLACYTDRNSGHLVIFQVQSILTDAEQSAQSVSR
jgi:hypothetical protein